MDDRKFSVLIAGRQYLYTRNCLNVVRSHREVSTSEA